MKYKETRKTKLIQKAHNKKLEKWINKSDRTHLINNKITINIKENQQTTKESNVLNLSNVNLAK